MQSHRLAIPAAAALFAAAANAQSTLDVALCGAASTSNTVCQWTDVQTRLMATGMFNTVGIVNVTTTGGGTPTLAQLQAYDAVLCYTNVTPADNVGWGDVLADYVDAGGGVVVAVFANSTTTAGRNIAGRWQTGYEVILDQGGNTGGAGATLGAVAVPGHPVMGGVTAFAGGTTGSRPTGTALEVGSFLIASWSDGKVLAAAGANPRRIDLGFYPPHSSCSQSGWTTGGDLLMANALVYVSGGAVFQPFGAGCAGSLGIPTLAAAPGSRPALGSMLTVNIGNLPLGVAIMAVGFSGTMNGPFQLPLDLAPFGMPGCNLLTEIITTQFLAGATNTAAWTLSIPTNAAFSGVEFFGQAFSFDPPANVTGLTVSNGGRGRVGL